MKKKSCTEPPRTSDLVLYPELKCLSSRHAVPCSRNFLIDDTRVNELELLPPGVYSLRMLIIPASASRNSARGIAGEKIRITEMAISEIEVSAVTIDGAEVFPALLLPRTWNGFSVPVFTRDTVEDIAAFFREAWARNGGGSVEYDGVSDAFIFTSDNGVEVFDLCNIGGRTFYGIGAGAWAWHALTEEEYGDMVEVFSETWEALASLEEFLAEAVEEEARYLSRLKKRFA